MPRYIDGDALVEILLDAKQNRFAPNHIGFRLLDEVIDLVDDMPTVKNPKAKRGKWIESRADEVICSYCNHAFDIIDGVGYLCDEDIRLPFFCPNCGAKMDGGDNA